MKCGTLTGSRTWPLAVAILLAGNAHAGTFVVDATVDAVDANPGDGVCATAEGDCTLRAAVMETNHLAGADTIFLPEGIYVLTLEGRLERDGATGDLDVFDDLTIRGAGSDRTIVDANRIDRAFIHVNPQRFQGADPPPIEVRYHDLTIRDGYADASDPMGGCIALNGTVKLLLRRTVVRGCEAAGMGGGIGLGSPISVESSGPAGSPRTLQAKFNDFGDFVDQSVLLLDQSSVLENQSGDGGGGIAVVNQDGDQVTIVDSVIADNSDASTLGGGGILVAANARHTNDGFNFVVEGSEFSGNSTGGFGGAIRYSPRAPSNSIVVHQGYRGIFQGLDLVGNTAALGGGGIAASSATDLSIGRSLISDNATDGEGGGLLLNGRAKIADSEIRGNTALLYGAGVEGTDASRLTLERVAVTENMSAGTGGGVLALGAADVFNTTVSTNSAAVGGGIRNFALDDADGGDVYLANVTLAANTSGGGADLSAGANGAAILVRNSIVDSGAVACSGLVVSLGHNIASDGSCDFVDATDLASTDAMLLALADNGGPTRTHALETGSPAIDAGAAEDCAET
ncbi:MAG: hypothetical protein KC466_13085, partial [Myxococcales bacterium]|nr:hypothetical protein [Myxococcales bacterium]